MRIGILTDIHGDYESLCRVIERLEQLQVDRLMCLGDLVVHGPLHNEVVDFFRTRPDIPVVRGNHDIGATIDEDQLDSLRFFSASSRVNTETCRSVLTPENHHYLKGLPLQVEEGDICYTHATVGNPFALLRHPHTIAETFARMPQPVLIAGHTHRTRVHHWPAGKAVWCTDHPAETRNLVLELVPGDRYIINVGSVCQLKYDFYPPMCAVYEPENRRLEFHELEDIRPPGSVVNIELKGVWTAPESEHRQKVVEP